MSKNHYQSSKVFRFIASLFLFVFDMSIKTTNFQAQVPPNKRGKRKGDAQVQQHDDANGDSLHVQEQQRIKDFGANKMPRRRKKARVIQGSEEEGEEASDDDDDDDAGAGGGKRKNKGKAKHQKRYGEEDLDINEFEDIDAVVEREESDAADEEAGKRQQHPVERISAAPVQNNKFIYRYDDGLNVANGLSVVGDRLGMANTWPTPLAQFDQSGHQAALDATTLERHSRKVWTLEQCHEIAPSNDIVVTSADKAIYSKYTFELDEKGKEKKKQWDLTSSRFRPSLDASTRIIKTLSNRSNPESDVGLNYAEHFAIFFQFYDTENERMRGVSYDQIDVAYKRPWDKCAYLRAASRRITLPTSPADATGATGPR